MFVVVILLTTGLAVTYPSSMTGCDTQTLSFCVVSQMILTMPSWIGSFCGVLISATLAFQYSLRKQKLDDNYKKNREDLDNANKAITLLSRCFGDLGNVKLGYCDKFRGDQSLTRGLMYPYMLRSKFTSISFDPTTLYFLMSVSPVSEQSPKNPNYIYNLIQRFNTIMSMIESRNSLALEMNECLLKVDVNKMNGTKASLELDYFVENFGLNKLINFLIVTEKQINEVDDLISEIALLMYELPIIFDNYFKGLALDDKNFTYRIASFDPYIESNKSVLTPIKKVDIDFEVSKLLSIHRTERLNWRPKYWVTY
ncbi:hypothetical protein [Vibrio campbellii]|uniref:hypothetical protein n=3 Tax=Vibrio campbellii TaxID=680 RepID=UPI00249A3EA3|nr:hypothetical protein [Vibrio campbellii]